MKEENIKSNTSTPGKKSYVTIAFVVVILVIALIWFFMTRQDTPTYIQPANAGNTDSTQGIPPDSLHH